jgi:hypothetical protein
MAAMAERPERDIVLFQHCDMGSAFSSGYREGDTRNAGTHYQQRSVFSVDDSCRMKSVCQKRGPYYLVMHASGSDGS